MDKINFQDGTKTSSAKVTIDEVDYPVTPARYTGATPLSANVMNTMQTNIENAINQNVSNIGGEDYDATATYVTGDIVKHNGQLYIANTDISTPEAWDSTHWDETDVLSSAGGNEVTIGTSADITGKTKLFVNEDEGTDAYSEVVNSLSGNEINKAPSVRTVNQKLNNIILAKGQTLSGEFKGCFFIDNEDGTVISGHPPINRIIEDTSSGGFLTDYTLTVTDLYLYSTSGGRTLISNKIDTTQLYRSSLNGNLRFRFAMTERIGNTFAPIFVSFNYTITRTNS